MKMNISISADFDNTRLDAVLCALDKTVTRSRAAELVTAGEILVNNKTKKPGYRVKTGDLVTGCIPEFKLEAEVLPENIPTDIVFEDDHLLVIHKKAGMVVHPAPGNLTGTLVNALLHHSPDILGIGEEKNRAGIVHRLDKDTSGLMVIAKTSQALSFLQKEFKERRVEKNYLALVTGNLPEDRGEINLPIGRHPVKRKMMAVNYETGKPALTLWKVQKRFKEACLVEIALKTGRTHQIRVHFYETGHPLLGDPVYQPGRLRKKKSRVPWQMLHSQRLSFRHPYSGQRMEFTAELPEDFLRVLALLESEIQNSELPIPPQF
ncbi:MAG: RluA family pseudouridine synthase [Desulfobacula sp.]|nr:RluA family pseudouridine synthase [Desulfobacula sp.]